MPSVLSAGRKDVPLLLLTSHINTWDTKAQRSKPTPKSSLWLEHYFRASFIEGQDYVQVFMFSFRFCIVLWSDFTVLHQGSLENQQSLPASVSVFWLHKQPPWWSSLSQGLRSIHSNERKNNLLLCSKDSLQLFGILRIFSIKEPLKGSA